jgi:hypothetical protein
MIDGHKDDPRREAALERVARTRHCPWCGEVGHARRAKEVGLKSGVVIEPHMPCTMTRWHIQAAKIQPEGIC